MYFLVKDKGLTVLEKRDPLNPWLESSSLSFSYPGAPEGGRQLTYQWKAISLSCPPWMLLWSLPTPAIPVELFSAWVIIALHWSALTALSSSHIDESRASSSLQHGYRVPSSNSTAVHTGKVQRQSCELRRIFANLPTTGLDLLIL